MHVSSNRNCVHVDPDEESCVTGRLICTHKFWKGRVGSLMLKTSIPSHATSIGSWRHSDVMISNYEACIHALVCSNGFQ